MARSSDDVIGVPLRDLCTDGQKPHLLIELLRFGNVLYFSSSGESDPFDDFLRSVIIDGPSISGRELSREDLPLGVCGMKDAKVW